MDDTAQVLVGGHSFAQWFAENFPPWVEAICKLREAGMTREDIEAVLTFHCNRVGAHLLFVVGARAWMDQTFGRRAYVPPVRFN